MDRNTICVFLLVIVSISCASSYTADEDLLIQFRNANPTIFQQSGLVGWTNATTAPCQWAGVNCDFGRVTVLTLKNLGLTVLPVALLKNLTFVNRFEVTGNNFGIPLPSEVEYLGSERVQFMNLDLSSNNFIGALPASLAKLTNLRYLNLSHNNFQGDLPALGELDLWQLDLSYNNFGSTLPSDIGNLSELYTLILTNAGLVGPLPSSFSLLAALQTLHISGNSFNGTIPSMDLFGHLEHFNASNNEFTGQIPRRLLSYTGELDVSGNDFRCPIPGCNVGFACTLATLNVSCTCECISNQGQCLWGIEHCVCNSNYYGTTCNRACPGIVDVNGAAVACNANGQCSDGFNGTGTCTCDTALGFGGSDCGRQCPYTIQDSTWTFCSNKGLCVDGLCQCLNNFDGPSCSESCKNGWAGPASDCRIECRGGSDNPCNGHGSCDTVHGTCTCNRTYFGEACQSQEPIGLIIGLVILAALILLAASLGAFFFWRKYKVEEEKEKFLSARKKRREQEAEHQRQLKEKQEGTLSAETEYLETRDLFKQYFDTTLLASPKVTSPKPTTSKPSTSKPKQQKTEEIEMDDLKEEQQEKSDTTLKEEEVQVQQKEEH